MFKFKVKKQNKTNICVIYEYLSYKDDNITSSLNNMTNKRKLKLSITTCVYLMEFNVNEQDVVRLIMVL